jgi:P27 family predicted phage terminase small subunit
MGGSRSGGKNRKPTAQKKAEGNRGRRALNEREPIPPEGLPVMPLGMSARSEEFWHRLLPIVSAMGVMTAADALALGQLCIFAAEVQECTTLIETIGRLIPKKDENGVTIGVSMNPAVRIRSDASRHVRAYLAAFGLDPSSRSGIEGKDPVDKPLSALDSILRAKSAGDDTVN